MEKFSDSSEKPKKEILLLVNGKEMTLNTSAIFERYGVKGWVRIPSEEFDTIDAAKPFLGHFNQGTPNHEVGEKYLVMRILRSGDSLSNRPPLLSLNGALLVECVDEKNNVLDELAPQDFEYSLPGIKDKASLIAAIQKRYNSSLGDIAHEGIAYTLFKIQGPA